MEGQLQRLEPVYQLTLCVLVERIPIFHTTVFYQKDFITYAEQQIKVMGHNKNDFPRFCEFPNQPGSLLHVYIVKTTGRFIAALRAAYSSCQRKPDTDADRNQYPTG